MAGGRQGLMDMVRLALGTAPELLDWPRNFALSNALTAMLDPQNRLLAIYGANAGDFDANAALHLPPLGEPALSWCSRVLVLARPVASDPWLDLGFQPQGRIPGYWADGADARLWAAMWGERQDTQPIPRVSARIVSEPGRPPAQWTCRSAATADAEAIGSLMQATFPDYRIPDDPGVIRYALASGAVHGRVICSASGHLLAYASAEFQPGGGAVEITDCATDPAARGHGLMTHLVGRLQEDLVDVFDGRSAYALVREDEPAMQQVCVNLGWRQTGRLSNHFRLGGRWLSVNVWSA